MNKYMDCAEYILLIYCLICLFESLYLLAAFDTSDFFVVPVEWKTDKQNMVMPQKCTTRNAEKKNQTTTIIKQLQDRPLSWHKNKSNIVHTLVRASDNSRGHRPAKFRYFREIPRNSPKNTKYREIRQKYFQIHVGKTHLILILAIRPVLFTSNVQIYLETSSLQRVNNVSKLPGVLRWTLRKTGH